MIARLTPVIFSFLLLAAHFLRGMKLPMVVLFLALIGLAFYRRPYVRLILRGVLTFGAFIWVLTAGTALIARQQLGEPWLRMVLILGAVALFTLWSSWLLGSAKAVAWYAESEPTPAEGS